MTTRACTEWVWCELDHSDPELRAYGDIHEKHVTVAVGDYEETFLLELKNGNPRLECAANLGEVWREPGEPANTLLNISAVWAKANDEYEAFLRDVRPSLRRDHDVTRRLEEVEN